MVFDETLKFGKRNFAIIVKINSPHRLVNDLLKSIKIQQVLMSSITAPGMAGESNPA
jgi:hypothetical protein